MAWRGGAYHVPLNPSPDNTVITPGEFKTRLYTPKNIPSITMIYDKFKIINQQKWA